MLAVCGFGRASSVLSGRSTARACITLRNLSSDSESDYSVLNELWRRTAVGK
jgi:hypothetical protein